MFFPSFRGAGGFLRSSDVKRSRSATAMAASVATTTVEEEELVAMAEERVEALRKLREEGQLVKTGTHRQPALRSDAWVTPASNVVACRQVVCR